MRYLYLLRHRVSAILPNGTFGNDIQIVIAGLSVSLTRTFIKALNIHSISFFPCGLGVFGESCGQKLRFFRSLPPVN